MPEMTGELRLSMVEYRLTELEKKVARMDDKLDTVLDLLHRDERTKHADDEPSGVAPVPTAMSNTTMFVLIISPIITGVLVIVILKGLGIHA